MRNAALKTREIEPDVYLPFGRHVTDTVISLTTRALLTVIRIDGTSFETAETADLNDLHAKLNLTLRNVADPTAGAMDPSGASPDVGSIRTALSARHLRPRLMRNIATGFASEALFRNDLYLTLVWHPGRATTDAAAAFFKRLGRAALRIPSRLTAKP